MRRGGMMPVESTPVDQVFNKVPARDDRFRQSFDGSTYSTGGSMKWIDRSARLTDASRAVCGRNAPHDDAPAHQSCISTIHIHRSVRLGERFT
jgi:hypothetical protein